MNRYEFLDRIGFVRAIDTITSKAKEIKNIPDRAALYQVLMEELLTYHNDSAKIEFYDEIEDWARVNSEKSRKRSK